MCMTSFRSPKNGKKYSGEECDSESLSIYVIPHVRHFCVCSKLVDADAKSTVHYAEFQWAE